MSSIPEVPQNVLCLKCGRDAVILTLFLCCTFVKENRHCNSIKVIRPRLLSEEQWRIFTVLFFFALYSCPGGHGFESWHCRSDNRKGYIGCWIYPEFSMAWTCEVFRCFSRVLCVFNVVWHKRDWDIETMGIGCIMQVALWSRVAQWRTGTRGRWRQWQPVHCFSPSGESIFRSLSERSLLSSPVNFGFDRRGRASNSPEFVSENILLRPRTRMTSWWCWCRFVTVVSGFCSRPCLRWSTSSPEWLPNVRTTKELCNFDKSI